MRAFTDGPTPERFRKYEIHPVTLLAQLKPTTDQARFYRFDAIKASEDCGTTPTQGFRPASKNVKRPVTHTKGISGITGGIVEGASPSADSQSWGHSDIVGQRRCAKSARKLDRRDRKRAALIAELQRRGYSVA
jgi:hypothetical protein